MPIFEYRCEYCGQIIEKIQRKPLAEVPCPVCNQAAIRKVSLTSVAALGDGGGCSTPSSRGFT